MTAKKTFILFIVAISIMTLVIAGYAYPHPPTVAQNSSFNDFPVHISLEDLNTYYNPYELDVHTPTNIITKNFSEIEANNYADIPILIPPEGDICQISDFEPYKNENRTAAIALNNTEFQAILRSGGIIRGIYYKGPDFWPTHGSYCSGANPTLDFIVNRTTTGIGRIHVGRPPNMKAPSNGSFVERFYT